jgi:hypothetical protein
MTLTRVYYGVYYGVVYAGIESDFISDSNEPLHIQIGPEMVEIWSKYIQNMF